jgi:hypothetical protein
MLVNAMKIETDQIDEFTGQRTVITSWEKINYDQNHIRFRLQNGILFLDWKMLYNGAVVISEGDKIMFKATDGDISSCESTTTEFGAKGAGATGVGGSLAWGIFAHYTGHLEWFANHTTKLIRIYTSEGYVDREVKEKEGRKISALYNLFSSTIDGKPNTDLQSYEVSFLKKRVKAKEWDLVKDETIEYISKDELNKIMQDWKSQTSETMQYDCKIKKLK